MAIETGFATDSKDLYQKLVDFLTTNPTLVGASEEWTVLDDTVITDDAASVQRPGFYARRTYFQAPGPGVGDEVYCGIEMDSVHWTAEAPYATYASSRLRFDGLTGYDGNLAVNAQPGTLRSTNEGYLPCIWLGFRRPGRIEYKFMANGRRFIICKRDYHGPTGQEYAHPWTAAYCGLALPFGTTVQDPYPFVSAAPAYVDNGNRNGTNGSFYSFRAPGGTEGVNQRASMQAYRQGSWKSCVDSVAPQETHGGATSLFNPAKYAPPFDEDEVTLFPLLPFSDNAGNRHVFGALDGVFERGFWDSRHIGIALPTQDTTVQVGGVDHLITIQGVVRLS